MENNGVSRSVYVSSKREKKLTSDELKLRNPKLKFKVNVNIRLQMNESKKFIISKKECVLEILYSKY